MEDWIVGNWFAFVQSLSILFTLLITLATLLRQLKQTKVSNSLLVTQHHRELWTLALTTNSLSRVFEENPNLIECPITEQERIFVNLLFLHMSATLKATKANAIHPIDGMEKDVRDVLSFPIPRQVWKQVKDFHDKSFVCFADQNSAGVLLNSTGEII